MASLIHGRPILVFEVPASDSGIASDSARDAHQKHGAGTPFDVASLLHTSCI
jgi:hypothetical protein